MKILWSGVLAGAAFFAQDAAAQCGVVRHHAPVHYAPVVKYHAPVVEVVKEVPVIIKEVPVAVPVLVPAFQFQYVPPACPCPQPQPPVAALPPQAGYGYGPPAAPHTPGGNFAAPGGDNQARIRELAKALLEEMQRQSLQADDQGPPMASDPHAVSIPPLPTGPAPRPGVPNPNSVWGGAAFAALQRNCAACHTGVGSKGDYQLFSQPGALNPEASLKFGLDEIKAGRMPPKSSQYRMTPEEITAVENWVNGL